MKPSIELELMKKELVEILETLEEHKAEAEMNSKKEQTNFNIFYAGEVVALKFAIERIKIALR